MSGSKKELRTNKRHLYHIVFFVASVFIVVAISPRQGKFRYEFQKGKPWLSAALIAPWDFPVLKPETVIAHERDSIVRNFAPYFRYDPEIGNLALREFDAYLDQLHGMRDGTDPALPAYAFGTLRKELHAVLETIYKRGILEINDATSQADVKSASITVVTGKVAEKRDLVTVFTQKDAYTYAAAQKELTGARLGSTYGRETRSFIDAINYYNFIRPNLFYDAVTSTADRERLLDGISISRGLVQEGELIITRGEIVNDSRFIILESLRNEYEKRLGQYDRWLLLLGRMILVASCYLALYLFMYHYRLDILNSTHKTFFIILVILLFLIITRLVISLPNQAIFLVPFAIIPIVIRTFYDSRLALFIHMITIMLAGFFVPNSFEFVFMSYIAGVIAIVSLSNIYRRAKLFTSALMVFLAYSVVYMGIGIMQEGTLSNMRWANYTFFAGNGVLLLLSYPLIFVFEKTFRFLSDATLFELADTNQPLLRRLASEAPGSFQHSLQVANLAEEAAREIGANHLLVRTGALYHDIGKIGKGEYFIENQQEGFNPHDTLGPKDSATIIINHVNYGIELARKYKLPSAIIDFIQTHHGNSMAYFFYKKHLDQTRTKGNNHEKDFSYPGPRPFTRETAIVMMADAVEASSRTLQNYSEENISELVERIIYLQEQAGQFAETPLTFRDISDIKSVFIRMLSNIYHARIVYPNRERPSAGQ